MTTSLRDDITLEEKALLAGVGYEEDSERAGTCVLVDQEVRHIGLADNAVEILPLAEALRRYDWVQDIMFGLIDPDEDEHIAELAESRHAPVGHFVRVLEGAKVRLPIQLFTLLEAPQGRQFHHNITVIEKDAEVEMISGSAVPRSVHAGHHVSLSETYLAEGAVCRSVSIEQWASNMEVHSYARSFLDRNAHATDSVIQLAPVSRHVSQSRRYLEEGATGNDQTIIYAPSGTTRIMDSETLLKGQGARAESITRMVTAGGVISNRSTLVGDAAGTSGFLGCNGLKLTDEGEIFSVPALRALNAQAQLSHEASIGMIDQDRLSYLMASGMSEDQARDLIIQGFLNLDEQKIPETVRVEVMRMIAAARSGAL
ncbi:SufD family Fe-S cluster assembly protein [Sphingomonas sp. YL-JM2C]